MNPITGIASCCARTENGQAAVAPPSNLMVSFDYLVGGQKNAIGYRDPKCLGRFEIDY
jgi:hypothetical protein